MDIEVSIVTGTYNRILHLKRMVQSVRNSVGTGVPYEIVVVDGGSTDETLQWCKEQKDIVLIEQGKLLGAVKAFNAGCARAVGRYVVLANDDIEFIGYSILSALSFMHDNPMVGIGCFAQDRGQQSMHVGVMSAVVEGRHTTVYYGQVCIVPRWLGNKVGWWGDYLYTYGGDNELSCNVLELGYKVLPAPCAMIHDALPADALRVANNQALMKNGKHPDTEAWLKKWTHKGILGPIVKSAPDNPNGVLENLTRFFYMPIYEPGHTIQKETKRGLRNALAKVGLVTECDYLAMSTEEIMSLACAFDANVFVTQFHGADQVLLVEALREQHPAATFVNWNGDYHPEHLLSPDYIRYMQKFDAAGFVTTSIKDAYDAAGVNWFYWQIGYEVVEKELPVRAMKAHDVLFQANGYSRDRLELATNLRLLTGINIGIYGSWPNNIKPNGNTLYDFAKGHALYKNCKIAIGDSQWPMATGFVSNRLFQAMYAGAFLLHQWFDGMEDLLGLKPGKHLVVWVNWEDLKDKIRYYMAHDTERRAIAQAGQKFIMGNHSFDRRVMELLDKLGLRTLHV